MASASKKRTPSTIDIIGWVGVVLIVASFTFTTFEFITPQHISYPLLNIIGSICIIVSSYTKRDFQPVALNVVWLVIAAFGLIRTL